MSHLRVATPTIDRTRAMLAETALEAAGGGRLRGLQPEGRLRDRWIAIVRTQDGAHVTVELDARLGTVTVRPPVAGRRAA